MEPTATHEIWYYGHPTHMEWCKESEKVHTSKIGWTLSRFSENHLTGMGFALIPINFSLENK